MNYYSSVIITGFILESFKFHHDEGIKIFETKIGIERKNGIKDILTLRISEKKLKEAENLEKGDGIIVFGELRTYRYLGEDSKVHDKNYIYAEEVWYIFDPDMKNQVKLFGKIVKKFLTKSTNNIIVQAIIETASDNGTKKAYIPVVFWDEVAEDVAYNYEKGDDIGLIGKFRSREYTKQLNGSTITRTTYEVSASKLIL